MLSYKSAVYRTVPINYEVTYLLHQIPPCMEPEWSAAHRPAVAVQGESVHTTPVHSMYSNLARKQPTNPGHLGYYRHYYSNLPQPPLFEQWQEDYPRPSTYSDSSSSGPADAHLLFGSEWPRRSEATDNNASMVPDQRQSATYLRSFMVKEERARRALVPRP